jgi:hypothetical protein
MGYDDDPNWYAALNLKYSLYKLCDFYFQYSDLPEPLARLNNWLREWKDGVDDYDHLDNDNELLQRLRAGFF